MRGKRWPIPFVVVAAAFGFAAHPTFAQTGGLEIQVVDPEGSPLPGATVTLSHETGSVKTTARLSDREGVVVFPVLKAGSGYSVQVEAPGHGAVRNDGIRVRLGQLGRVSVQLIETLEERLTVVADRQVVALASNEVATRFSDEFISDLPVPGRFYQNVLVMTPGVQDSNEDGNPNVHGSRTRDFSAMVNGVRNVDPLTGQWMSRINPNSIEEMEVVTAGAGVEFGRAQGGFARIIQKQGNNQHEGVFDLLYRTSKLDESGANDFNKIAEPEFTSVQPGFQLSGPILRDKLWYFLAHERIDSENPVSLAEGVRLTTTESWTHSDRLTWQVSPRNKLSFQFQSDPFVMDNIGVSSETPEEATRRLERTSETYTVSWTAPVSPGVLVESLVSWQELSVSDSPSQPDQSNNCYTGSAFVEMAQCQYLGQASGLGGGSPVSRLSGSYPTTNDDRRQRLTVSSQATLFGGRLAGASHQLKVGMSIENERYFRSLQRNATTTRTDICVMSSGPPLFPPGFDICTARGVFNIPIPDADDVRATGTNWGLYAEDQIRATNNLTLTVGLRVDREELDAEGRSELDTTGEFESFRAEMEPLQDLADSVFIGRLADAFVRTFTGYEDFAGFERRMQEVICAGHSQPLQCFTDVSESVVNQLQSGLRTVRRAEDTAIVNTNVSPFFSIAWSPWSNGKTAFKAAVGRHYNNIPQATDSAATLSRSISRSGEKCRAPMSPPQYGQSATGEGRRPGSLAPSSRQPSPTASRQADAATNPRTSRPDEACRRLDSTAPSPDARRASARPSRPVDDIAAFRVSIRPEPATRATNGAHRVRPKEDMAYQDILLDKDGALATITLNRPEKLNAYTTEMGDEVTAAFRSLQRDDAVRVILLTGAGRAFCAGVDLEHLKAHERNENASRGPKLGEEDFLRRLPLEIRDAPKPVIAALNGHAIGVGMTMAMPCDVRIASEDAQLGFVFAKLGILPGLGSTHLLPHLVGMARAQELVLTGRKIRGTEAAAIGLVNRAVPEADVLPTARAVAEEMAEIDPAVLAHAKRALHYGAAHTMAQAMRNERAQSDALRRERTSR